MKNKRRNASLVVARIPSDRTFRGLGWGFLGGLAGTLAMDILLIIALMVLKQPAFMCFSIVGDTVARFLAMLGIQVASGIPTGVVTHYLIGPLFGTLFGAAVTMIPALRESTLKKITIAAFVYVEILSQPILATTPILLKMDAPAIVQWYGGSFVMHLILSIVLGVIVGYGLRTAHLIPRTVKIPWWKGIHGEWYVVAQFALVVLVFFGPTNIQAWPGWNPPFTWIGWIGGGILLSAGLILLAVAIFRLGSNLTAVPYPKEQGTLIETGPYRLVRHPMYCGGILIAMGWAFLVHGWLTFGYAVMMFVFFDFKSRREEEWLKAKFPGYRKYQKRVRKLIPFVY
jgi:protein-S-isoprenylcysteine O-methyltransferase Ste14